MRYMNPNGRSRSLSEMNSPPMGGFNDEVNYYEAYEDKPEYEVDITQRGNPIARGLMCMYDIERTRKTGFCVIIRDNKSDNAWYTTPHAWENHIDTDL